MPPGPNKTPIRVKDFRVVCDTMLQGLGRQLRTIGVDAEILTNTQNHNVCVAMCNENNRMILTKGTVYDRVTTSDFLPNNTYIRNENMTTKTYNI